MPDSPFMTISIGSYKSSSSLDLLMNANDLVLQIPVCKLISLSSFVQSLKTFMCYYEVGDHKGCEHPWKTLRACEDEMCKASPEKRSDKVRDGECGKCSIKTQDKRDIEEHRKRNMENKVRKGEDEWYG